nr:BRISC and BRCA1-A complex member 2-like isoform X2 [Physcomitrium patens]|eukprot:XP_024373968.1 BRISC and BRCA1-A complex member 2-like isoform X2 [Physcomitrella patens]
MPSCSICACTLLSLSRCGRDQFSLFCVFGSTLLLEIVSVAGAEEDDIAFWLLMLGDVVYNGNDTRVAPDIIFGADDETFQPLMDDSELSPCYYLRDWTVADPTRLLKLILLIRGLYLQYQRKKVEEVSDERVRFEMSTMAAIQGLEMCVTTISEGMEEVNFAFPLVLEMENPHSATNSQSSSITCSDISLQVKFPVRGGQSGGGAPQLKLVAPEGMRDVFDVDDVKLPVWPEHMCLVEYKPTLELTLQQQVREARASVRLRRNFVEALFPFFGHPLEVDTLYYRKASILTSFGVFTFLVHFVLPIQFPKIQPSFTFQSSQHFDARGKPLVSRLYQDYPWSPRWEASEMAQRIFDFVAEECLAFKRSCGDILSQR